ncbi:MAG TPA: hypothetical protein VGH04_11570 [Gemmatimonadaceae bacterium]|jgi:Flp pilus assembly protein TadD
MISALVRLIRWWLAVGLVYLAARIARHDVEFVEALAAACEGVGRRAEALRDRMIHVKPAP